MFELVAMSVSIRGEWGFISELSSARFALPVMSMGISAKAYLNGVR